jgi:hypothetical protein
MKCCQFSPVVSGTIAGRGEEEQTDQLSCLA